MTLRNALSEIVVEATSAGEVLAPLKLFRALEELKNPVAALFDRDATDRLFGAFFEECGHIARPLPSGDVPPEAQQAQSVALLRWFMTEITTWEPDKDLNGHRLAAILITAQAVDAQGGL